MARKRGFDGRMGGMPQGGVFIPNRNTARERIEDAQADIMEEQAKRVRTSPISGFGTDGEGRMTVYNNDGSEYTRYGAQPTIAQQVYDNYDAIEVPFTDAIPSDYDGVMGVPISFLDKYCPEQFEIVGIGLELADMKPIKEKLGRLDGGPRLYTERDGQLVRQYERILIRRRK